MGQGTLLVTGVVDEEEMGKSHRLKEEALQGVL